MIAHCSQTRVLWKKCADPTLGSAILQHCIWGGGGLLEGHNEDVPFRNPSERLALAAEPAMRYWDPNNYGRRVLDCKKVLSHGHGINKWSGSL